MTYIPNIDLNFSRPLDVHRWSDYPEANTFVDKMYTSLPFINGNKKIRKKHFKVLLLDLYVAWCTDPNLKLAISRDNNSYVSKSRYNELHISKVIRWTCHGSVPIRCSRYAAFRSKAMGLFQPKAECLRRGL